jgi:hypothetical protein
MLNTFSTMVAIFFLCRVKPQEGGVTRIEWPAEAEYVTPQWKSWTRFISGI